MKKSSKAEIAKRFQSAYALVGLPSNAEPYPDGTSVIEVAVDHEFGSDSPRSYESSRGNKVSVSGVPERSFMRSTAKEKRAAWSKKLVDGIGDAIKGKGTFVDAVSRVGIIAESDIKQKIVEIDDPPNSPQVIEDKGSSNPLVDTGHLTRSITHAVIKGKE